MIDELGLTRYLFGVLYPEIMKETGEDDIVELEHKIKEMYLNYDIAIDDNGWNILPKKLKWHETLKRYFNATIFHNDPTKRLSFSGFTGVEKVQFIEFVKIFAYHKEKFKI
jgi:hypothetical protein